MMSEGHSIYPSIFGRFKDELPPFSRTAVTFQLFFFLLGRACQKSHLQLLTNSSQKSFAYPSSARKCSADVDGIQLKIRHTSSRHRLEQIEQRQTIFAAAKRNSQLFDPLEQIKLVDRFAAH